MRLILLNIMVCFAILVSQTVLATPSLEKLESIVSKAQSFEDFLSNRELLLEYKRAIRLYYGEDQFDCLSYGKIISSLKRMNQILPDFGRSLWKKSENTKTWSYERVADPGAKNPSTTKIIYRFRMLPRKLHGIWVNTSFLNRDCQKMKCDQEEILTPSRWSVGLRGSELFVLERNKRFSRNSIMVLPIKKDDKNYRLVSIFGSDVIKERGYFKKSRAKTIKQTSLFELWLAH